MLKELKAHHRNIIQMSFNGFKNNEIAERLGMTQSTVSLIINSPLGKAYLEGLQDKAQKASLDVRKELISMNKKALDTFNRLLDPTQKTPAAVQYNTAKDILDRTGYKASDKIDLNFTLKNKSDEELEAEIAAIESSIQTQKQRDQTEQLPIEDMPKLEDSQIEATAKNSSETYDPEITNDEINKSSLSNKVQDIVNEVCSKPFDPFKNID